MRRRTFCRLAVLSGAAVAMPPWVRAVGAPIEPRRAAAAGQSLYGRWVRRHALPAFVYAADHETLPEAEWDPLLLPRTRRHWLMVGNRAIRLQAANDGTVALFDERDGLRWLTAPDPVGTGISLLDDGDITWGTDYSLRAGERIPLRIFGPTWFQIRDQRNGLRLERTIVCPEGEVPWLLIRVRLELADNAPSPRTVRHTECWALRPRFCNLLETPELRRMRAELAVSYEGTISARGVIATERFASVDDPGPVGQAARFVIGPPATLALERLGATPGGGAYQSGGSTPPFMEILSDLTLEPAERRDLWFRFGHRDEQPVADPAALLKESLRGLARRLPRAGAGLAPAAAREIPWHAALVTGGLAVDRVIGGHSLDQASTYSYVIGFNGAARDPLQHALPLVYFEPALALSVLRNTCAWAQPNGDLPYALDAAKRPTNLLFRPSDANLWALWLAAEYAAATGDLAAFDAPLAYHPRHGAEPTPLREHLRRQFRFFVDEVGRGEGGHVRILNADWNDAAIADSGVDPQVMIERGGSVLNSAMAAWVLPVFAGLADRLGEAALAAEARAQGEELRGLVAQTWNGRWFHRAYAPGAGPVGDDDCWLEVQPWAILCGAADATRAHALLDAIDTGHRADSPLGARLRWPADPDLVAAGQWGQGTLGGTWYSINMTLIWAAARVSHGLAWDEWRRMTLAGHTAAYPAIWEGTLSGPDSYNAPESSRPGRTWGTPAFAMQAFPVNNMHSHAQPLLAFLRLLGIEPTGDGSLATGHGGRFRSRTFRLGADGHGSLQASGPVLLQTRYGPVSGGPGTVAW